MWDRPVFRNTLPITFGLQAVCQQVDGGRVAPAREVELPLSATMLLDRDRAGVCGGRTGGPIRRRRYRSSVGEVGCDLQIDRCPRIQCRNHGAAHIHRRVRCESSSLYRRSAYSAVHREHRVALAVLTQGATCVSIALPTIVKALTCIIKGHLDRVARPDYIALPAEVGRGERERELAGLGPVRKCPTTVVSDFYIALRHLV